MATLLNLNLLLSNLSLTIITSKIDDSLYKYIFYGENDCIAPYHNETDGFYRGKNNIYSFCRYSIVKSN